MYFDGAEFSVAKDLSSYFELISRPNGLSEELGLVTSGGTVISLYTIETFWGPYSTGYGH